MFPSLNIHRTNFWLIAGVAIVSGVSTLSSSDAPLTYSDAKPIIDRNCVHCHGGDGEANFFPFTSFEEINGMEVSMAAVLSAGTMPKDNPAFHTSADGQKLIKWLTEGAEFGTGPVPTPTPTQSGPPAPGSLVYADAKSLIDRNCVGCHNARGAAKFLPFTTLAEIQGNQKGMADAINTGRMPKGHPEFLSSVDAIRLLVWLNTGPDVVSSLPDSHIQPRNYTYSMMKPIIARNCVRCHNAEGEARFLPLDSLDGVRRNFEDVLDELSDGKMPRDNRSFRNTDEGQALLRWLRFGADLDGWRDRSL